MDDFPADRLNHKPALRWGCTSKELLFILIALAMVTLPVFFILGAAVGYFRLGLGAWVLASIFGTPVVAMLLQRYKRGRPNGYYQQKLRILVADAKLQTLPAVRRTGTWTLGRTR